MISPIDTAKVCKLLLFLASVCGVCCAPPREHEREADDNGLQWEAKKPTGNEVRLEVKLVAPRRAVVTVHNDSDTDIYLAYIPGGTDKFALHASLGYEKFDPARTEFQPFGSGDFGSGLSLLRAHDYFRDEIFVRESGRYRVTVRYLTDKTLAARINRLGSLQPDERLVEAGRIAELSDDFTQSVTSDTFAL